ncbi:PKD domain-containing protein [Candidatus Poseidoniales archaeon]|nr:PKD domain-containing protein [Candidatus Poseidoniales archaeon]
MGNVVKRAVLLSLLIASACLAGCTSDDDSSDNDSAINLVIYYDATSGMIQENIQNGQQVSFNGVELTFDYAYTKSADGNIESYYFEAGDGSSRISAQANDTGEITYNYATHGLFTAVLGAIDEAGNEANESITIRIDKRTLWGQSNTDNPDVMTIDTMPDCECDAPSKIAIDSTIENIQNAGGIFGGPVTVSWLLSGEGVERDSGQEQIADGQNAQWIHDEFNPGKQSWSLEVTLSENEERVNIDHDVTITYNDEESKPNPLPTQEQ